MTDPKSSPDDEYYLEVRFQIELREKIEQFENELLQLYHDLIAERTNDSPRN